MSRSCPQAPESSGWNWQARTSSRSTAATNDLLQDVALLGVESADCDFVVQPADEFGATLFVSHHLDEIDASYWVEHTGQAKPDAQQVLQLLELRLDPEEDEIDILDFTLPGAVTNYVICVEFDGSGNVTGVSMES